MKKEMNPDLKSDIKQSYWLLIANWAVISLLGLFILGVLLWYRQNGVGFDSLKESFLGNPQLFKNPRSIAGYLKSTSAHFLAIAMAVFVVWHFAFALNKQLKLAKTWLFTGFFLVLFNLIAGFILIQFKIVIFKFLSVPFLAIWFVLSGLFVLRHLNSVK